MFDNAKALDDKTQDIIRQASRCEPESILNNDMTLFRKAFINYVRKYHPESSWLIVLEGSALTEEGRKKISELFDEFTRKSSLYRKERKFFSYRSDTPITHILVYDLVVTKANKGGTKEKFADIHGILNIACDVDFIPLLNVTAFTCDDKNGNNYIELKATVPNVGRFSLARILYICRTGENPGENNEVHHCLFNRISIRLVSVSKSVHRKLHSELKGQYQFKDDALSIFRFKGYSEDEINNLASNLDKIDRYFHLWKGVRVHSQIDLMKDLSHLSFIDWLRMVELF